ncbi:hypothetical protein PA10_00230 [Pseudomonas phage pPa_SNUABM_DT01]|nr:hypothetical protein PA10_00230 [Pseudomonas phage pPa_SNUABM_DT01]
MMTHYQHQDDHIVIGSVAGDEEALASLLNKFSDAGIQPTLINLIHEDDLHLMMVHHKGFDEATLADPQKALAKVKEILNPFADGFTVAPEQP